MQTTEIVDNVKIITSYYISYTDSTGSGWVFPSDQFGNADLEELKPAGLDNYHKCVDGTHPNLTRQLEKHVQKIPLCSCGSGEHQEEIHDARGIFVVRVCSKCKRERLKGFRKEIFTDSDYEHDEPISEDHWGY